MENKFLKKLSYSYIFEERLERVFQIWTNPSVYKCLNGGLFDEFRFIKGNSLGEKGAIITIKDKHDISYEIEVSEVIKSEECYNLTHCYSLIKETNKEIQTNIVYHFYWNTIQSETLLMTEVTLYDENIYNHYTEILTYQHNNIVFKKFDNIIKTMPYYYEQLESIIIDRNIKIIFDILIDFEKFKNYGPGMGDYVIYDGSPLEIDTKIHVYFNDNSKQFHMKVNKCIIEEDRIEWGLTYLLGIPKVPAQDIVFEIVSYKENKCIFRFKHIFKKYLKFNLISKTSQEKKQLLKTIKDNFNKDNN